MKKIIGGKVYDTDKATRVGGAYADCMPSDLSYWAEELYIKRTGEYFVHGYGGPMTRFARSCGQNEWAGGETIQPLAYDAARAWAEKNLDADDFIRHFGDPDPEEDNGVELMTISLPASVIRKIKMEAQQRGMPVSALIGSKFA